MTSTLLSNTIYLYRSSSNNNNSATTPLRVTTPPTGTTVFIWVLFTIRLCPGFCGSTKNGHHRCTACIPPGGLHSNALGYILFGTTGADRGVYVWWPFPDCAPLSRSLGHSCFISLSNSVCKLRLGRLPSLLGFLDAP